MEKIKLARILLFPDIDGKTNPTHMSGFQSIFDRYECSTLRIELIFNNPHYQTKTWNTELSFYCFYIKKGQQEIYTNTNNYIIKESQEEFHVVKSIGSRFDDKLWKTGEYLVEVYNGPTLIAFKRFFIESNQKTILINRSSYLKTNAISLTESHQLKKNEDNAVCQSVFNQLTTRYIWFEIEVSNLVMKNWAGKIFIKLYNSKYILIYEVDQVIFMSKYDEKYSFSFGLGYPEPENWTEDKYFIEVKFIDFLISTHSFRIKKFFSSAGRLPRVNPYLSMLKQEYYKHNGLLLILILSPIYFLYVLFVLLESIGIRVIQLMDKRPSRYNNETYTKTKKRSKLFNFIVFFFIMYLISSALYLPIYLFFQSENRMIDQKNSALYVFFINSIYSLFGFIALLMLTSLWTKIRNYIKFFGIPKREEIEKNLALKSISKAQIKASAKIKFSLILIALMVFFYLIGFDILFYLTLLFLSLDILTEHIYGLFPPRLLYLATSSPERIILNSKLAGLPFPIASLLDYTSPAASNSFFPKSQIYRTNDQNDWFESVIVLTEICKILILDTREVSEPVMKETQLILERNYIYKTIFIVSDDHKSPVLNKVFIDFPNLINKELFYEISRRKYTEKNLLKLFEPGTKVDKLADIIPKGQD